MMEDTGTIMGAVGIVLAMALSYAGWAFEQMTTAVRDLAKTLQNVGDLSATCVDALASLDGEDEDEKWRTG